jgi:hypothetical protein
MLKQRTIPTYSSKILTVIALILIVLGIVSTVGGINGSFRAFQQYREMNEQLRGFGGMFQAIVKPLQFASILGYVNVLISFIPLSLSGIGLLKEFSWGWFLAIYACLSTILSLPLAFFIQKDIASTLNSLQGLAKMQLTLGDSSSLLTIILSLGIIVYLMSGAVLEKFKISKSSKFYTLGFITLVCLFVKLIYWLSFRLMVISPMREAFNNALQ